MDDLAVRIFLSKKYIFVNCIGQIFVLRINAKGRVFLKSNQIRFQFKPLRVTKKVFAICGGFFVFKTLTKSQFFAKL